MSDSDTTQPQEDNHLAALEPRFLAALARKDSGDLDGAEDELRAILKLEPRLAEPHIELARVLLDTDRLQEAEAHVREGIGHLEVAGPWTEEVGEAVILALANALLAEILRRRADEDDVIFGEPERFHAIVRESRERFRRAAELDPSDEYASYHSFFLGVRGHGGEEPGDPDA